MSLTNPNKVVTEERLNEYHRTILPYLGGNSMVACGGGYAPIGTVIAYMGTRAPSDFLICDGTVYNIADYTELADFFELQFGSANFFGGDGATTFAVPDLRGEFLRGTGTNSHANQGSGANVGEHQDGTIHMGITSLDNTNLIWVNGYNDAKKNADSQINISSRKYNGGTAQTGYTNPTNYTSRPTNTSVLYCIKAKSQGNGYSLDEQIVGTWIDGKPLYQKTIEFTTPSNGNWNTMELLDSSCVIRSAYGVVDDSFMIDTPSVSINGSAFAMIGLNTNASFIKIYGTVAYKSGDPSVQNKSAVLTLQYTKTTDV